MFKWIVLPHIRLLIALMYTQTLGRFSDRLRRRGLAMQYYVIKHCVIPAMKHVPFGTMEYGTEKNLLKEELRAIRGKAKVLRGYAAIVREYETVRHVHIPHSNQEGC